MRSDFCAILAVVCILVPRPALAATIDQILAAPSSYDGHHVDAAGNVSDLRSKVSRKGNAYVTFSLCSDRCIHVFAFGSPNIAEGQRITVHGSFAAMKHQGSYLFYNEIDADDDSL